MHQGWTYRGCKECGTPPSILLYHDSFLITTDYRSTQLLLLSSMSLGKGWFPFTNFWRAHDFLRLIVDLGMRTYDKKAREYDRTIAKKASVCSTFFERSPVVANQKNRSFRKWHTAKWRRSCGLVWLGIMQFKARFAHKQYHIHSDKGR